MATKTTKPATLTTTVDVWGNAPDDTMVEAWNAARCTYGPGVINARIQDVERVDIPEGSPDGHLCNLRVTFTGPKPPA